MGREVKRVPLDFDHPLNEVWPGFVRVGREFPPCPDCRHGRNETLMDRMFPSPHDNYSTGLSREAYAIESTFYPHQIGGPLADVLAWCDKIGQAEVDMLVEEHRLGRRTLYDRIELSPPYETDECGYEIKFRFDRNDRPNPTAAEVNAANGRAGTLFHDGHHDGINRHLLVRNRCRLLGIEMNCATCTGRAVIATDEEYAAEEAASEAWEREEPPLGVGWQLWETVSEGSPVSPVFATAEDLAAWMAEPERGRSWMPTETAMKFIEAGWAPTGIVSQKTGVVSGMEYVGWTEPAVAGESSD